MLNSRKGFSLIELLIVIAIIVILVAAVVPQMSESMLQARETAALQAVRTIQTAQAQHYSQNGSYATSLAGLGKSGNRKALIPDALGRGTHSGYRFVLEGDGFGYRLQAMPVKFGGSGRRSFFTDESLIIRCTPGPEPATADSPEIGSE